MDDASFRRLGRPLEILLVEDNYGDVLLTVEAFRSAKLASRINIAGDGEEALRILRREGRYERTPAPDVILLDLMLPRKDGREVLADIKRNPATSGIPVVILTGSNACADTLKIYELGADSYIVKPVDFESVLQIAALSGRGASADASHGR